MIDLPKGARVAVAMSGGVDSSVTAALLQEAGLNVVGITMRLLGGLNLPASSCCGGPDIRDAVRVADFLKIPHHALDFEHEFEEEVVRPFAASYARGETPSPCIDCNRNLKFRHLIQTARELGAQALATGHYAKRLVGPDGVELHQGADPSRDQSYFLFALDQSTLDGLRFPLGGSDKTAIRAYAARLGLPVASKPDSQDICFVSGDYAEIVGRYEPGALTPGDIVDTGGRVLGRHKGLAQYTVGQRRGLGLGGGPPLYVLELDARQNRVVAGPRQALGRREIHLRDLYWLAPGRQEAEVRAHFRIRSTRKPVPGTLFRDQPGEPPRVLLDEPEEGVAPGQACVVYLGSRVLGGGWIQSANNP